MHLMDRQRMTIRIRRTALAAFVIGAALAAGLARGGAVSAQSPVRTIEDGALDKIELFVATLEKSADVYSR